MSAFVDMRATPNFPGPPLNSWQRSFHPSSLVARLCLFAILLATLQSCTGPTTDNIGNEFRKKWIATRLGMDSPFEGIRSESERNQFIDEFLVIKDLQFRNYVTALRRGSSYGDLTADAARLTLDGLASVTGTATVKSGLAATSAGITGFTGAVKKDVLFNQSLPVFIDKMVGIRANKRADIIAKKSLTITQYPASEAFADVEEYGGLGTFDAALRALNTETGRMTGEARAALADVNGDEITAQAERGQYEGPIASKVVRVTVRPTPAPAVMPDANKLRRDINKLTEEGARAMIEVAKQYADLQPVMAANPQGTRTPRSYLAHLIAESSSKPEDQAKAELKAWRAIIPVNPVAAPPPGTPPPIEPAIPQR